MISAKKKWTVFIITAVLRQVKVQVAVPILPMMALPPPPVVVPVPSAVIIHMPDSVTTTTTTTTERNAVIAFPVPVPFPAQFAVPGHALPGFCQKRPDGNNCPPCPPCQCVPTCTPAFFSYCSPCHQKCRCRSAEETPTPLPLPGPVYPLPIPLPVPLPPPVIVVPFPPKFPPLYKNPIPSRPRRHPPALSDIDSSSLSDSTGFNSYERIRERKRVRNYHKKHGIRPLHRKHIRRSNRHFSSNELKPELAYVARNGDVKYKTRISSVEARALINNDVRRDTEKPQMVNIVAGEDSDMKPQLIVSRDEVSDRSNKGRVVLRKGVSSHVLDDGPKQLVFSPPENKRITNLSVSFQIV